MCNWWSKCVYATKNSTSFWKKIPLSLIICVEFMILVTSVVWVKGKRTESGFLRLDLLHRWQQIILMMHFWRNRFLTLKIILCNADINVFENLFSRVLETSPGPLMSLPVLCLSNAWMIKAASVLDIKPNVWFRIEFSVNLTVWFDFRCLQYDQ